MCGIAGYITQCPQADAQARVRQMSAAIAARGPDGKGTYASADGRVHFAHRRLSIISPGESGAQPMSSMDGAAVITFNGEIYNYLELRRQLEEKGCRFAGQSDTEVILQAYLVWGKSCLERLRGMFAFAVHDTRRDVVFVARDRLGIKPFYYRLDEAGFAFASSADALRAAFGFGAGDIDRRSVAAYLHHQFIPAPMCIWQSVRKLMPGTWLEYSPATGRSRSGSYWDIRDVAANAAQERHRLDCADMRTVLDDCVDMHMRSDVELGLLLSGGLDSGVLSRVAGGKAKAMPAFTLDFGADRSEAPLARSLARKAGLAHHEFTLAQAGLDENLGVLARVCSEPLADSSTLPVYYLSGEVARHVKVVLGGDGGDELFFGYKWYMAAERMRAVPGVAVLPRRLRNALAAYMGSKGGLALLAGMQSGRARLDTLHGYLYDSPALERAVGPCGDPDFIDWPGDGLPGDMAMRVYDLMGFTPDSIMHKVDAASMAHGLEVRVPFLDHEVVEYALRLDPESLFDGRQGKQALRRCYGPDLPGDVLVGGKFGFSPPLARWRGALEKIAQDILPDGVAVRSGVIDGDWMREQVNARSWRKESRLWMLLTLEKWLAARLGGG